jgi:hypothetical protein
MPRDRVLAMFPITVTWTDAIIDGRKCASANIRDRRLYVCERFGKAEALIDGVNIGIPYTVVVASS